jgi:3-oxoacyl-[acyl-carrier-protein] synthase III
MAIMSFPTVYLSLPGVCFPENRFTNDDIIKKLQKNYRGSVKSWPSIESAVRRVLEICNTKVRYLDLDPSSRVAKYAAKAALQCLDRNSTRLDEIDLVIFSGIAREYFEPATAMEVAQTLGIKQTHAFDVTTACVGQLEAIQIACAYLNMYEHYRTALICTAELSREFLSFDIQSTKDLYLKAAGLTIGNAASCMLVRKEPWQGGCVRLITANTYSLPKHWELCQVPIHGTFQSSSTELMKLHKYIVPQVKKFLGQLNWKANDVDYYIFHQPSETATKKVIGGVGANLDRGIYTHHLYGNNASATIGVVFDHLLKEKKLRAGDKLLFGSAAGVFSMVTIAGEWVI